MSIAAEATSDATATANDVANVPPVTQSAATVNTTLTNDDTHYDKELFTSDDDSNRDTRVKKSKLNPIESKTIDAMKNAATAVIFMNIFNLYCTQYRVDPSLKTIMDNGAASYELIQLLQLTMNRSKTIVPVKTDYEATKIKMIEAYYNHYCNSVQDSIKVDLNKINNGYIVFRKNKNLCLDCGYSNHQTEKCRVDPVNSKISQYHHLEDYDFSINKDSLYTLNSFYNQNISNELIKQTQQQDVHKNINKLKEYIKESYGIKLITDTNVLIPESVKSEMKYKPKKIEFNTSTELPNVDDTNYIVNIFNPKRNNSDKKVINDDKHELLYTFKFDKETDKPIITLLHGTSSKLGIIDVLFGNDILKDSIINQKDKLIKLNNSRYLITSNYDIKEQVAKFVEGIPSQICDILVKSNPVEEDIQLLRDYINDSFEDVIVDKLPDIAYQINNSKKCNIIHNIIIKKDQEVEPTKKQIYYSTDEHKRHVEEIVLKFIDLGIIKRSESNYSSPIMLLKKRDSWHIVHNHRQLNKVTVRDDHPFTPVDSLLNQCKDSKLFSKFDMIMGYF
ncbi:hypothetical protein ACTFIZ_007944 [Dictyostelium cf. discoideum]